MLSLAFGTTCWAGWSGFGELQMTPSMIFHQWTSWLCQCIHQMKGAKEIGMEYLEVRDLEWKGCFSLLFQSGLTTPKIHWYLWFKHLCVSVAWWAWMAMARATLAREGCQRQARQNWSGASGQEPGVPRNDEPIASQRAHLYPFLHGHLCMVCLSFVDHQTFLLCAHLMEGHLKRPN